MSIERSNDVDKAELTRLDKVRIWLLIKRLRARQWRTDRLPRWLAWKLPKVVVKWAVVRAAVMAAGMDQSPAEVTYPQMVDALDNGTPYERSLRR